MESKRVSQKYSKSLILKMRQLRPPKCKKFAWTHRSSLEVLNSGRLPDTKDILTTLHWISVQTHHNLGTLLACTKWLLASGAAVRILKGLSFSRTPRGSKSKSWWRRYQSTDLICHLKPVQLLNQPTGKLWLSLALYFLKNTITNRSLPNNDNASHWWY